MSPTWRTPVAAIWLGVVLAIASTSIHQPAALAAICAFGVATLLYAGILPPNDIVVNYAIGVAV